MASRVTPTSSLAAPGGTYRRPVYCLPR